MAVFLTYLTDRISRLDVVVHGLAFGSGLGTLCSEDCFSSWLIAVDPQSCTMLLAKHNFYPSYVTQFILVQPATHNGNSLKNLFTKYTIYITNQTKQRTSIVPWSQIHGTGQSKPRTSIVIYVDFNEMLTHPADIQHRHTTGGQAIIQHTLTHTAHYHTESYLSTAQKTTTAYSYIHQTTIIKNTYFGEVRWDEMPAKMTQQHGSN